MKVGFPLPHQAVAEQLLGTHREPHEDGDDHGDEQEVRDVLRCPVAVITTRLGGPQQHGKEDGQYGGFQQVDQEILAVLDLPVQVALSLDDPLGEPARAPNSGLGQLRRGVLLPCRRLQTRHDEHVVEIIPLFWADPALTRRFAPSIQYGDLDDVEDLLGVHMAALAAGDLVRIEMVDDGAEMRQCIEGSASEYGVSTLVEDPQGIEASENVTAGLMDDRHDEGTGVGHLLEQVHQEFGVLAAQAARRLIDEEDLRLPNELEGDVQPLSLAAADRLVQRVSDRKVACLLQPQLLKATVHPLVGLGFVFLPVGEPRSVPEVLLHRQFREQMVLLRHEPDVRIGLLLRHGNAVEGNAPEGGLRRAGQEVEQGGLS